MPENLNCPLFAAGLVLGNPLLLGLLVLVALPIAIHFWSRKNETDVPFAAVDYLLGAAKKHSRRIQMENWIILFFRCVAFGLLAFIFVDPFWQTDQQTTSSENSDPSIHHLIVIDASYSMAAESNGRQRLEEAKQFAKRQVEAAAPGDAFSLIVGGGDGEAVIAGATFDRQATLNEIDRIEIVFEPMAVESVLRDALAIKSKVRSERVPKLSTVTIYSDMTRASWNFDSIEEIETLLNRFDESCSLLVVDVGDPNIANNVALAEVNHSSGFAVVGERVELDVIGEAFGTGEQQPVQVSMTVDDELLQSQSMHFDQDGKGLARFTHAFQNEGDHRVEFKISNDPLGIDNQISYVLEVQPVIDILLIGGRYDSTELVELALVPDGGGRAGRRVERVGESEWPSVDLTSFDLVVLSNVAAISEREGRKLVEYIEQGGGAIIGLGDLTQPQAYNRLSLDNEGGETEPWFGAEIRSAVDVAVTHFSDPDYAHRVLRPFQGFTDAGLLSAPTWRYWQLQTQGASQTLLRFETGDPALIETRRGDGILFLFAGPLGNDSKRDSSPDQAWTGFPVWPSFVPILQEAAIAATEGKQVSRNQIVGSQVTLVVPDQVAEYATVTTPADEEVVVEPESNLAFGLDEESEFVIQETSVPGFYRLELGSGVPIWFAMRLPIEESDLGRVSLRTLPERFRVGDQVDFKDRNFAPQGLRTRLYPLLIKCLIGVLILELFLALLFGRASWQRKVLGAFSATGNSFRKNRRRQPRKWKTNHSSNQQSTQELPSQGRSSQLPNGRMQSQSRSRSLQREYSKNDAPQVSAQRLESKSEGPQ